MNFREKDIASSPTYHAPYKPHQPKTTWDTNVPKTSARSTQQPTRVNLTLHDWFTVFRFIDEHPGTSQDAIVQHFKTLPDGALIFDQSTLSRKLKDQQKLEEHAHGFPNALSSKRLHIVTSPAVDWALFLWVKHMEEKGEHVTGDGSIQYAATWYLPAGVLALKGGSGMGSRVIRTQFSEFEVYICYMKCM